ncbi:hypothetical protein Q4485_06645 [Granulosicoccaceae sp. 1_MG-2023]|nr:hypothetical protein [Granulosicoccaceae sp. 1_MG-2023]
MEKDTDVALASLRPGLAPSCKLYYDTLHKRWVMRGPNQVVFPDADSLQVLLLCDGKHSLGQISHKVNAQTQNDASDDNAPVFDIVMRFLKRGFLQTPRSGASRT